MGIETDIHQVNFKNEFQKAMVNLIYTSNWVNDRTKVFFDRQDITPQQFNILRILRGANKPLSTIQIRTRMLDKMSDTSRMVDRLVKKGLVLKTISLIDKRLVDVTISETGKQVLYKLDTREDEMLNIMNGISEDEAVLLNTLLDKLRSK
ncbi:MAG: MarR family transcriptional regulator [Niastella sp.]|nr:MarR family transcriptional regulator [Niastella sp.]